MSKGLCSSDSFLNDRVDKLTRYAEDWVTPFSYIRIISTDTKSFRIFEFPPACPGQMDAGIGHLHWTPGSDLSCGQLHNNFLDSQSLCPLGHLIGLDCHHGCHWLDVVQVKHLYSAIVTVAHIDLMVVVSDTPRWIKLSIISPFLPNRFDHLTKSTELLHSVSTSYIHIVPTIDLWQSQWVLLQPQIVAFH